jgi:hypothetical protein
VRQLFNVRSHELGAEGTVHADGEKRNVRDRVPEGFNRLAADKSDAATVESARCNHRQPAASGLEVLFDGKEAGFEVERVDDRLDQQQIDAAFDERGDLLLVRIDHVLEIDAAPGRVVHARRNRHLLGGGADGAGDKSRLIGRSLVEFVGGAAGTGGCAKVDFADQRAGELKFLHANEAGAERIGFYDVRAGSEVLAVNLGDVGGASETENVAEPAQVLVVRGETIAADIGLRQLEGLDHRAHRAVENQNAVR